MVQIKMSFNTLQCSPIQYKNSNLLKKYSVLKKYYVLSQLTVVFK